MILKGIIAECYAGVGIRVVYQGLDLNSRTEITN